VDLDLTGKPSSSSGSPRPASRAPASAHRRGARVTVTDAKPADQLAKQLAAAGPGCH
jgi:hypothetical protein